MNGIPPSTGFNKFIHFGVVVLRPQPEIVTYDNFQKIKIKEMAIDVPERNVEKFLKLMPFKFKIRLNIVLIS